MEIIANNIANAQSTRTPNGGAYRRQEVVFEAIINENDRNRPGGVCAAEVMDDPSEMPTVFNPGHPDADADGFVTLPNV